MSTPVPMPAAPAPAPAAPLALPFAAIGPGRIADVGGKGANLAWMARAGLPVPPGFCVTTAAFARFLAGHPDLEPLWAALDAVRPDDVDGARGVAADVRAALEALPLPPDVASAVRDAWLGLDGPAHAWAVRSSATAEDLPGASFAGQHDTHLAVRGEAEVLDAVRRCFASLFTDRAVLYRARNGFGHRTVALAVVVQRMVAPEVSGILFTADPVTGDRATASIDAGFGLGEALVGGLVDADLYRADKVTGALREARVGDKALAIRALPGGGTVTEPLPADVRTARALTEAQVSALAAIGRRIEDAAGSPQDIEWCYAEGELYVVQARPITSLFPLPDPVPDDGLHLYFSFGHAQMMPDAMPPLARDAWVQLLPFGRGSLTGRPEDRAPASRALVEIGARLYVDVTAALRVPPARRLVLAALTTVYPQIPEALAPHLARIGPDRHPRPSLALVRLFGLVPVRLLAALLVARVDRFGAAADARVAEVLAEIARDPPGFRAVRDRIGTLFPSIVRIAPYLGAGIVAQRLLVGLGVPPDALAPVLRALPHNVTTEMDLALADLADLVRPHQALAASLARSGLAGADAAGAPAFREAFAAFVARYGMRGPGEIDLSRPRWRDDPQMLVNVVLANVDRAGARQRHAEMAAEADAAIARIAAAAPFGRRWLVRRLLRVVRAGQGLREHPKFLLVHVLERAREAALAAGARLAASGALARADDVWFLRLDELADADADADAARAGDLGVRVAERRAAYARDAARSPPLAMTSDGELLRPAVRTDLPPDAIGGVGASAGVIEGVARVVRDPGAEVLQAGEILVAPFTDPGWTPLFTHAAGVVTEIGGRMTHGSVIAREMGIPAVVGATGATTRIRTGDRIQVDGDNGWVVVLPR